MLIDCKYRLLEKQHPSKDYKSKRRKDFLNGAGVLNALEEYLPEDSVDLLPQKDREVSIEEPSKPVVSQLMLFGLSKLGLTELPPLRSLSLYKVQNCVWVGLICMADIVVGFQFR